MDEFSSILDIIIVLCGAYIVYAAILLKVTGEIKSSVLINRNIDLKKCRDLEGYRNFLFPRAVILGLLTMIFGGVGVLNGFGMNLGWMYKYLLPVLILIFVWYLIDYRRGLKKFWGDQK